MKNKWGIGIIAAAAGLLVAVLVGVLAVASSSDDDTVADEGTTQQAEDASQQAIAIGEAMVTAIDERDRDVIDRLFADDATINVFDANSTAELENILRWFEAVDWRFELRTCGYDPDGLAGWRTACIVLQRNAWSEALGAPPVEGTFTFRIEDGEVNGLRFRGSSGTWYDQVIAPFEIYVRQQSREDDLEMNASNWWERDDADVVIAKFERYTDEFVASVADSVPGTNS